MDKDIKKLVMLGIHSGVFFSTAASILLFSGITFSPVGSVLLGLNVAVFGTMSAYYFLGAIFTRTKARKSTILKNKKQLSP